MSQLMVLLLILFSNALAHMQLSYPAPLNASNNPHRTTPADPYLQYPYNCCGPGARWEYPCRGYQGLLGTPDGSPIATWQAGSEQHWSLEGIGNHYGGSCQIGFSTDRGQTFRVSTSYEGNCPHRNGSARPESQEFPFTVPHDLTPGVHIFAWTWYNREQEFSMNCAAVNITVPTEATLSQSGPSGYDQPSPSSPTSTTIMLFARPSPSYRTANGLSCICANPTDISTCDCECPRNKPPQNERNAALSRSIEKRDPFSSTSFSSRPLMFVADVGNGCLTPKPDAELKFPEPGWDVISGDGKYPLQLPQGKCSGV